MDDRTKILFYIKHYVERERILEYLQDRLVQIKTTTERSMTHVETEDCEKDRD